MDLDSDAGRQVVIVNVCDIGPETASRALSWQCARATVYRSPSEAKPAEGFHQRRLADFVCAELSEANSECLHERATEFQ